MRTGLLTEIVTIQRVKPAADNAYGVAAQDWEDVMTIRATIDHRNGDRVTDNFEQVNTNFVKVTTHLRKSIKAQMRVVYGEEKYYIQSCFHDRRNGQTILNCEMIND